MIPSAPRAPLSRQRLAIVAVALGVLGVGGALWMAHRSPRGSAASLLATGRAAYERGDYETAFLRFSAASMVLPEDARLAKAAAESALGAGRRPEATRFATLAWQAGLRDEDLLAILLLDDLTVATEEGRRRAAVLIAQLPAGPARDRCRARLHAQEGDLDAAIALWQTSLSSEPRPHFVDELLRLLATHQRISDLLRIGDHHRQRGELGSEGYRLLALAQARANHALPNDQRRDPRTILEEADQKQLLDDHGRLALGLHHWYHLDLTAARETLTTITTGEVRVDAALFAVLMAIELGQEIPPDASAAPQSPREEGLQLVHMVVASAAPAEERIQALRRAEKLLGPHPVPSILLGRLLRQEGRFEEALLAYRAIDGLAASAPTVLIDQAELQTDLGRVDAALALIATVERLHGSTQRSLALVRRLIDGLADGRLRRQLLHLLHQPNTDASAIPLGGAAAATLDAATIATLADIRRLIASGQGRLALERCATVRAPDEVIAAHRALAWQSLGHPQHALAAAAIAAQVPQPPAIALVQAAAAVELGRPADADDVLAVVLAAQPDHAEAHRLHIVAALIAGDADEVHRRIDAAQTAGVPASVTAPLSAFAAVTTGNRSGAIAELHRHLAAHGADDPFVVIMLAGLLTDAQQPDAAREVLHTALATHPNHPDLLRLLVVSELERGDAAAALAAIERIPVHDTDGRALRLQLLLAAGEITRAQQLVDQLPTDVPAAQRAVWGAAVHRAAGRPAAAALLLVPHLADQAAFLAWIDLAQHGAPVDLAAGLRGLPPDRWRSILAAGAAERRGDWPIAAALMADALARWGPDDAVLLNNWAWYHHHVPDHDAAAVRAHAQRAFALAPDDPAILETVIQILVDQGNLAGAATMLQEHEHLVTPSAPLRLLRGDVHAQQGDRTTAIAEWTAAFTLAEAAPHWTLRVPREQLQQRIASP